MHHVENVSEASQTFQVRNPQGGFQRVILKPGQSGDYDVDPNQGRFQEGGPLKVTPIEQAKPAKTKATKPVEPPEAEAPVEPTPEESHPAEA